MKGQKEFYETITLDDNGVLQTEVKASVSAITKPGSMYTFYKRITFTDGKLNIKTV